TEFFREANEFLLVATRDSQHVVERSGHQRGLEYPGYAVQCGFECEGRRTGTQLDVDDRDQRHAQCPQIHFHFVFLNHTGFFQTPDPVRYSVGTQEHAFAELLVAGACILPKRFDYFSVKFVHGRVFRCNYSVLQNINAENAAPPLLSFLRRLSRRNRPMDQALDAPQLAFAEPQTTDVGKLRRAAEGGDIRSLTAL